MRLSLVLVPIALAMPGLAAAQTREGQFAVRASVVADCQVSAADLNFGVYDPAAAKSGSTVINLRCTPGSAATIMLDGGSSGNPQARRMVGPANLNYQLYRDAAHQDPINTNGMAFQLSSAQNTGQSVPFTVHGQIPAGQMVPAGNFVDQIRITVQF